MTDTGLMSDDLDLTPSPLTAHLTAAHHLVNTLARYVTVLGGTGTYEHIEAHAHHMREVARYTAAGPEQQWPPPTPVCTTCGQEAHVTEADQPYCVTHWPRPHKTLANPDRTRTPTIPTLTHTHDGGHGPGCPTTCPAHLPTTP